MVLQKILAVALILLLFPFSVFALNDIQFTTDTDIQLLTKDTAVLSTITVQASGVISNVLIETNYIDVTLDNGSTLTLSTADNVYFMATVQSGSGDSISPTCPLKSISILSAANVVVRIELISNPPACSINNGNNGNGNGNGGPSPGSSASGSSSSSPSGSPFVATSPIISLPSPSGIYKNCVVSGSQPLSSNPIFPEIVAATPLGNAPCRVDIFSDNKIDIRDFNVLMVGWGKIQGDAGDKGCNGKMIADINCDSTVDIIDFNVLMVYWDKIVKTS